MKKPLFALIAGLALCSNPALAVPTLYNTTFTATLGPSGTGSFLFDSVTGDLTNFVWDFGSGIVGSTSYGIIDTVGDTHGRFAFEILSEIDVHSGVDCVNSFCASTGPFSGLGPNAGTFFRIASTPAAGSSYYDFRTDKADSSVVASGTVTMSPAAAPEASAILLVGGGLVGILLVRRKRSNP